MRLLCNNYSTLIHVVVETGMIVGEMRRSVCVESSWEGREYYCELSENKPLCTVQLCIPQDINGKSYTHVRLPQYSNYDHDRDRTPNSAILQGVQAQMEGVTP